MNDLDTSWMEEVGRRLDKLEENERDNDYRISRLELLKEAFDKLLNAVGAFFKVEGT